jgi:hypothetical protein
MVLTAAVADARIRQATNFPLPVILGKEAIPLAIDSDFRKKREKAYKEAKGQADTVYKEAKKVAVDKQAKQEADKAHKEALKQADSDRKEAIG